LEGERGRLSLTQTKKAGVFYVSIAAFEKIRQFFKFLVLPAKMRIDKALVYWRWFKKLDKLSSKIISLVFSAQWIKFLTTCSSIPKSYFLAAENARNYLRVVLKIFEKILGKIFFGILI
jgi:hypothetical protein